MIFAARWYSHFQVITQNPGVVRYLLALLRPNFVAHIACNLDHRRTPFK